MAKFTVFKSDAKFYAPSEGDVITPDANGATLDPTFALDVPLVWDPVAETITATMTFTTAETHPNRGWVCVLPWRADDNSPALRAPSAVGFRKHLGTPPPGLSGVTPWIGIATDVALLNVCWVGMNWDAADPRAVAGVNASPGVSGTRAGLVDLTGSAEFNTGALASKCQLRAINCGINKVDGSLNTVAPKTTLMEIAGQTWLCFGVFPHGATGQIIITFSPTGFIRQLGVGERF